MIWLKNPVKNTEPIVQISSQVIAGNGYGERKFPSGGWLCALPPISADLGGGEHVTIQKSITRYASISSS